MTTLEVDAVDVTAYLLHNSLRVTRTTVDFTLVDPPFFTAVGMDVFVDDPQWTGKLTNVEYSAWRSPEVPTDHRYERVTAAKLTDPSPTAAPFGLSDEPDGVTTFGFRDLVISQTKTDTGSVYTARCRVFEPGLRTAMSVELTAAWYGMVAETWYIQSVEVEFEVSDHPTYDLVMGYGLDPDDEPPSLPVVIRDTVDDYITTGPGSTVIADAVAARVKGYSLVFDGSGGHLSGSLVDIPIAADQVALVWWDYSTAAGLVSVTQTAGTIVARGDWGFTWVTATEASTFTVAIASGDVDGIHVIVCPLGFVEYEAGG